MNIRPARSEDSPTIARLLLLAMEEIVHAFIGNKDSTQALAFMERMVADPSTQYGWPNCRVAVDADDQVIGAVCVYDGGRLAELRAPVLRHLHEQYGRSALPEDETTADEWYIDTLGVDSMQQGKGIGSLLLKAVITEHVQQHGRCLGLLVDMDNPAAKKLYLRLGFNVTGTRSLMGKQLEHLRYEA